jgi:hypothetical protein
VSCVHTESEVWLVARRHWWFIISWWWLRWWTEYWWTGSTGDTRTSTAFSRMCNQVRVLWYRIFHITVIGVAIYHIVVQDPPFIWMGFWWCSVNNVFTPAWNLWVYIVVTSSFILPVSETTFKEFIPSCDLIGKCGGKEILGKILWNWLSTHFSIQLQFSHTVITPVGTFQNSFTMQGKGKGFPITASGTTH